MPLRVQNVAVARPKGTSGGAGGSGTSGSAAVPPYLGRAALSHSKWDLSHLMCNNKAKGGQACWPDPWIFGTHDPEMKSGAELGESWENQFSRSVDLWTPARARGSIRSR